MKLKFIFIHCLAALALPAILNAQTLTEIKLKSPLEETRGWCVDLFAHLTLDAGVVLS